MAGRLWRAAGGRLHAWPRLTGPPSMTCRRYVDGSCQRCQDRTNAIGALRMKINWVPLLFLIKSVNCAHPKEGDNHAESATVSSVDSFPGIIIALLSQQEQQQ